MNTADWVHDHPDDARKTGAERRTSSGRYQSWKTEQPGKEALALAKQALADGPDKYSSRFDFESTCGCCSISYAIPSVYDSIRRTGACPFCENFIQGLATGYITERDPTLEEALAAPICDIRTADIWVMRKTLLAQRDNQ